MNAMAVGSILKEGMTVGVKLGPDAPWHGNIVYKVEGGSICIANMDSFSDQAVPGYNAWIKYSNDYFVYLFSGTVLSVSHVHPKHITIKIISAEEMINSRLFPRYDVNLPATARPVWDNEAHRCTVTDLSYGGAAFICDCCFDVHEQLEMTLYLPGEVVVIVTGKVVRRNTASLAASNHSVQFIECDNTSSRQLSAYFSQLEDEVSELYRYYVDEIRGKI